MASAFIKISGAMAIWALGVALIVPQLARAEGPERQPRQLSRTDVTPAALQQASALIEQYVQPIAEPEPTPQEKRAIESAMKLLRSEQAIKGQYAIEQFLEIGPAALRDLRRLAASAPPEQEASEVSIAEAYPATMAAIIIRRIETAQRQAILEELISLGDEAHAVLSLKLDESQAAVTQAGLQVEAATAALVEASAGTTLDSPAAATERKALTEAQAAEKQVQSRQDMLLELRRLMAPKPPAQPLAERPAPPEEPPQLVTPPANVLDIQPISPPTGTFPFDGGPDIGPNVFGPDWLPGNGGWIPPPPYIFVPPGFVVPQQPVKPNPPPHGRRERGDDGDSPQPANPGPPPKH